MDVGIYSHIASLLLLPVPHQSIYLLIFTRMFERRYRLKKSVEDRKDWIAHVRQLLDLYTRKQNLFWQNQVKESHGNPKKLWRTLSTLL